MSDEKRKKEKEEMKENQIEKRKKEKKKERKTSLFNKVNRQHKTFGLTTKKKVLSRGFVTSRHKPDADRTTAGLRDLNLTTCRGQNKVPEEVRVQPQCFQQPQNSGLTLALFIIGMCVNNVVQGSGDSQPNFSRRSRSQARLIELRSFPM